MATRAATSATPALAKCQPYSNDHSRIDDGVYYYDGGLQTGTYGGIYANVYNYSPWVQPSSTTSAWTMLAEQSDFYAQVGWIECAGGGRYTFSQHTITPVVIGGKDNLAPQPVGVFTYYGTLWSPNTKVFTFQVNGSTVDQSPALSWTPGNAQANVEIHTLASQMSGAVANDENFWDVHVYNNGWVYWSGTLYNRYPNYFGNRQDDPHDFDI